MMIELTQTATLRVHVMLNGMFPDNAMLSGPPGESLTMNWHWCMVNGDVKQDTT